MNNIVSVTNGRCKPRVELGEVEVADSVYDALFARVGHWDDIGFLIGEAIHRHRIGDWGVSVKSDRRINDYLIHGPTKFHHGHWIVSTHRLRRVAVEIATDTTKNKTVVRVADARPRRRRNWERQ